MPTQAPIETKEAARSAAAKAISLLGGPVEAAKKVSAPSYQAVQSWRVAGVPTRYCVQVSGLTGISLQELRPSDWSVYWPATPGLLQPGE
ncbi:helix-turn-helix domain-containing protein [Comamonas sp. NyZ500]|uniref:YdaS family helix-turn-helix protein n=1 Tax=Comamonas sp. NyZ500 TaxID=2795732 RepID=UPI00192AA565|nr:YdaS family helix-turn-helix protein [Comamonas sp. NyZ500]MBL5979063.1 helix-turn-helix domain-containing protein [Comamonas sp. NyZ500]